MTRCEQTVELYGSQWQCFKNYAGTCHVGEHVTLYQNREVRFGDGEQCLVVHAVFGARCVLRRRHEGKHESRDPSGVPTSWTRESCGDTVGVTLTTSVACRERHGHFGPHEGVHSWQGRRLTLIWAAEGQQCPEKNRYGGHCLDREGHRGVHTTVRGDNMGWDKFYNSGDDPTQISASWIMSPHPALAPDLKAKAPQCPSAIWVNGHSTLRCLGGIGHMGAHHNDAYNADLRWSDGPQCEAVSDGCRCVERAGHRGVHNAVKGEQSFPWFNQEASRDLDLDAPSGKRESLKAYLREHFGDPVLLPEPAPLRARDVQVSDTGFNPDEDAMWAELYGANSTMTPCPRTHAERKGRRRTR